MIHVITVHWKDDRWIDLQLDYLKRNIHEPFRVYAFLNHIDTDHSDKFFYSSKEDIVSHATKLNLMADMVCLSCAPDDDWLLFIDGDAFPISDVVSFAKPKLEAFPLLAVRQKENLDDKQPHPLFCITTVGFWKKIKGDWHKGYVWECEGRRATDVGGNLLGILEKAKIDWYHILRTNKKDLHKVNFAIYGDVVYHHGASFRPNIQRLDKMENPFKPNPILSLMAKSIFTRRITYHYRKIHEDKIKQKNKRQSDEVFDLILKDKEFYKMLQ